MAWFKVDDKLHSHPKRYRAGLRAMGLWVTAGSWSSDQLTDGHIPAHMLAVLGGRPADAKALVDAELWVPTGDGWRFHDWQAMNPSRRQVEEQRTKNAEKLAKWRRQKREEREGETDV